MYLKETCMTFWDHFALRDICPVLKDCNALRTVTDLITEHLQAKFSDIDAIVGEYEFSLIPSFFF